MTDFLDSWVDVEEEFPGLGKEPYFVADDRRGELSGRLSALGFSVLNVDLSDSQDDEGFIAQLGAALEVPAYFGGNWDSLRDVLRERAQAGPWKIAIIVLGGRDFAERNLHDFTVIVSILREMSRTMSDVDDPTGQLEVFYIGI